MCTLSVLIVHYNTADLLRRSLTALFSDPPEVSFEVLVVDNASPDETVRDLSREFPDAVFHFNRRNVGFAQAGNQAIGMSKGRYPMLLNPDTVVRGEGLDRLVAFMEAHPDAGICSPRLVYPDGKLQLSCRRFPTLLVLLLRITRFERLIPGPVRHYLMADWDHMSIREVDWVIGACMVLRREALEEVGFLDGAFFMYYEDIDLCYRLWQKGWKVYYNPDVTVLHNHQRMSARLLPNRLSYVHARSLLRLWRKQRLAWF